ncbi:hypothetical protein A3F55_01320 [Candidatus Adlerbacteria bacterium RIFCSPHIGHO2_12_FULL_53_18]|uniref:Uncharacterized protein n=2 Tax=Parcubacteria group TaxID=1794811 RepID=A0A1F4XTU1_9BACT|nr:MAG: hypothetical protein A3F55_01320 [Candidatus Adlerbacteria bacterium RIFCSPHIGHO2_12_FULL_53_18]OGG51188.1 MAG: hypothetical protein A2704_03925 [Candidatus Kaiserbacteria bacterium RIFCSPHIGHO2_01_FULL_54_36b]
MCNKSIRVRKIFDRCGPEVARTVGEFFGDNFANLADDLIAGRKPVKIGYADRHGATFFAYSEADARKAAMAADSSY